MPCSYRNKRNESCPLATNTHDEGDNSAELNSILASLSAASLPAPDDHSMHTTGEEIIRGQGMSALASLSEDVWQTLHCFAMNREVNTDVLTWERLVAAANDSPLYQTLYSTLTSGAPSDKNLWPEPIRQYHQYRDTLLTVDGVVLLHDRPLIPVSLRPEVMDHLHAANAGVTGMYARASTSIWWPNMREDLIRLRAGCSTCIKNAPSNPSAPPQAVIPPAYPFHSVSADFFQAAGHSYLAMVCRYSGWLSLFRLKKDDSQHVMSILREYFSRWGIPVTLTTDGASVFVSHDMEKFLTRYGVSHRVSSYYYPRANKRAEVGVKSGKRLILDNISPSGSLNTDRVARALLIHHNQTDPISGLSPAEVIFGRRLRDHLPLQDHKFQPRAEWRLEADQREKAYAKRHILKQEQLSAGSKSLPPLTIGDCVAIQDASNLGKPGKWTKTGLITDCLPFQSYELKVDGSNLLTKRNRVHLRKITPFVSQSMLDDQRSNLVTIPVTTRSASSPTPPSGLASRSSPPTPSGEGSRPPSHTEVPQESPSPVQPAPLPHTNPPPETPKPPQPRPRVKEKWFLPQILPKPNPLIGCTANPSSDPVPSAPSFPLTSPPPPGQRHDYAALAERARALRDSIMSARTANLTT